MSTFTGQVVARDDVEEIEIEFDPIKESRRVAPRTTTTLMGAVKLSSGQVVNVRSVDVSSSGIGLLSLVKLEVGEECTAYIDLSVCGNDFPVELVGRVVYCRALPLGGYRAGLQFIHMTGDVHALLAGLLN
jgi:hypothetical protein